MLKLGDDVTLYNRDCREILPLQCNVVIIDPPYPDFNNDHGKKWDYVEIENLTLPEVRQFIFWPALREFPLGYTAVHIWHKPNGQSNEHYERIFERYGNKVCRVYRIPIINYQTLPEWTPHPTQKPLRLLKQIIAQYTQPGDIVLDCFMGSGTTGVAAVKLGRKFIGIEIDAGYFEIANRRISEALAQSPLFRLTPGSSGRGLGESEAEQFDLLAAPLNPVS